MSSSEVHDKEALQNFIMSEKGGGGIAKCYPVSYVQGQFANYHLFKK